MSQENVELVYMANDAFNRRELAYPGRYRLLQRKPMWLVDVSTVSAWRAAGR